MVAALRVARHGPASRSAALRKTAARSSKLSACQAGAACLAAWIAAATSTSVALRSVPSTWRRLCGCTTSTGSPSPGRWAPPMVMVSSARWPASSLILPSSAARSWLPGWYCLTGSLTGTGVLETASIAIAPPRLGYPYRRTIAAALVASGGRAGGLGRPRWRPRAAALAASGGRAGGVRRPLVASGAARRQVRQFLGGVPGKLVALGAIHVEAGGGVGGVHVRGDQALQRDRGRDHHPGGLVVRRVRPHLAGGKLGGQHHPAGRGGRVGGEQPQARPRRRG